MPGPEGNVKDSGLDTGEGLPQGRPSPVPSIDLLRRVILGLIKSVSDGAELIGASMREELEHFQLELEHRLVVILLVATGVVGISVGVMLFLKQLIGSWPVTLLLVGGAHVAFGVWLSYRWRGKREADGK